MFDITELVRGHKYSYKGQTVTYLRDINSTRTGHKYIFRGETGKEMKISQSQVQQYLWSEVDRLDLKNLEAMRGE